MPSTATKKEYTPRNAARRQQLHLPIDRNMNAEEVATALGICESTFRECRAHKFYAPDSYRAREPERPGKKPVPLWSAELVALMQFARQLTSQGVRVFSDDEALKMREKLQLQRKKAYLAKADE